jgi:hypothetical protein
MMTRAQRTTPQGRGGGGTTTTSKKESGRWTTQGKRGGENNGGSTMRWRRASIEIALWDRHASEPASAEMPHQAHPWHAADARLVPAMMADKLRLPPHHSSSVNFRFSANKNLTLTGTMTPHTHAESCESLSFSTVLGSGGVGGGGGGVANKVFIAKNATPRAVVEIVLFMELILMVMQRR